MQDETDIAIDTVLGSAALEGIPEGGVWRASLASVRPEEGVEEIVLSLETEDGTPHAPPRVALAQKQPKGPAMSNPVIENMKSRRSCRAFKPDPVPSSIFCALGYAAAPLPAGAPRKPGRVVWA